MAGLGGKKINELFKCASKYCFCKQNETAKTRSVLELGVGNGWAIKEISKISENNIIGIEISVEFRRDLLKMKLPKNIVILENDARDLSNEIPDGSTYKLLAINVIYFLEPFGEYILEFKRILKKGALAIWDVNLKV